MHALLSDLLSAICPSGDSPAALFERRPATVDLTRTYQELIISRSSQRCATGTPPMPETIADPPAPSCSLETESKNLKGLILIALPLARARTYREHKIPNLFPKLCTESRRCPKLVPIPFCRSVLTCFPEAESKNLNHLVLIPLCLPRATRAGVSPGEARATRMADRAVSAIPGGAAGRGPASTNMMRAVCGLMLRKCRDRAA